MRLRLFHVLCCCRLALATALAFSTTDPSSECFDEYQRKEQAVVWNFRKGNSSDHPGGHSYGFCPGRELEWSHETAVSDCAVPLFDASVFLHRMRHRTLIIAGDSLSKNLCIHLQRALSEYRIDEPRYIDPFDQSALFGCKTFKRGVLVCCGWIAFSYGTKERYNLNMFRGSDAIFANNLHSADIVLWNTGIHNSLEFGGGYDTAWELVNRTLFDWNEHKDRLPRLWWRETYPQHFKDGYYKSKEISANCFDISKLDIVNTTGYYNQKVEPLLQKYDVPRLPVYHSAVPLYHAHYNPGIDCSHWCIGKSGPYDHDVAFLSALIGAAERNGMLPLVPKERHDQRWLSLKQRWHDLMVHEDRNVFRRLNVCAHYKFTTREKNDWPMLRSVKECICSSVQWIKHHKGMALISPKEKYCAQYHRAYSYNYSYWKLSATTLAPALRVSGA